MKVLKVIGHCNKCNRKHEYDLVRLYDDINWKAEGYFRSTKPMCTKELCNGEIIIDNIEIIISND